MKRSSSGQALLIVLLTLSVALTAGLSLVARTTTDVSISEDETESNRAFEAAEAGVEEALKNIEAGNVTSFSETIDNVGANVEVEFAQISQSNQAIVRSLQPGEAATFWLNSFTLDGEAFPDSNVSWSGSNLKICWNEESLGKVEVIVYSQSGSQYSYTRYFEGDDGTNCSLSGFSFGLTITGLSQEDKFVNVRFYDTDSSRVVKFTAEDPSGNLPSQGTIITSSAKVSDTSRRIEVIKGWPELPDFFDFALFAGGSLTK